MRIALCFSGQPRCVAKNYPRVKEYLLKMNPPMDVFVHTWFSQAVVGKQFLQAFQQTTASEVIAPNVPEIIDELYKPIRMVAEPQIHFDEKNYRSRMFQFNNPFYSLSALYSIWKANELKKSYERVHSFTYDYVIRARFDWYTGATIVVGAYSPEFVHTEGGNPHPNAVGDQFAISKSYYMDIYSELFHQVDGHWNEGELPFDPGPLLYYHLMKHSVPFVVEDSWNPNIERGN